MARSWKLWVALLVAVAVAGAFAVWRQNQPGVSVRLDPAPPAIGHVKHTIDVVLTSPSGSLASVRVELVQAGTTRTLLTRELAPGTERETRQPVSIEARSLGLAEGPAELRVFAQDHLWRPRPDRGPRLVHRLAVDLTPPTVEIRGATRYIKHAGAGIVIYRVAGAARSGVRVGSAFFPGVSGLAQDPAVHVALFAVPYDGKPIPPSVVGEDEAGNERVIGVPATFLPARFPKDTIRLDENFLRLKVPELAPQTPGTASSKELLDAFLSVNREGRKAAEAKIRELTTSGSAREPLWRGVFRQQPNTKVFANFPEERTYLVGNTVVDSQWHLGIDLASRKRSPVAASNAGRVVFAGPNGIYGNMVVLDHGLGLFSLYGHLSEIGVTVGQSVAGGETLGRSGETGLAGGDHLHFATLIHGVYTTPLEWWDERWLRDRIGTPLREAGIVLSEAIEGAAAATTAPASEAPAAPSRKP